MTSGAAKKVTKLLIHKGGLVYILMSVVYIAKGESVVKHMKKRFVSITWRILIVLGPVVIAYGDAVTQSSKWGGG